MRKSPLRTPLAKLRMHTGLTQKELGDLVGVSAKYIQIMELGTQPLPKELGSAIAFETGVEEQWLLASNTKKKPRDFYCMKEYTYEVFKQWRKQRENPEITSESIPWVNMKFGNAVCQLTAILANAFQHGDYALCEHKIFTALNKLQDEFGADKAFIWDPVLRGQIGLAVAIVHGKPQGQDVLQLTVLAEKFSKLIHAGKQSKKK